MLLVLLQSILDGFAVLLSAIVAILPSSPFQGIYNITIDSDTFGYVCYFLPIPQMVSLLETWGTAVLVYYAYMIPMRWVKAVE